MLTLRAALLESNNRAATALQQRVGSRPVLRLASHVGLDDMPDVPSLSLGTGLVTPLELTAAYATFPNGGLAVAPRAIVRVLDADGGVALDNPVQSERVVSVQTAYQMVSMLGDVVDRGTGQVVRRAGLALSGRRARPGRPTTSRTRGSSGSRRTWSSASGSGSISRRPIGREAYGSRYAAPIWTEFMRRAARTRPPEAFDAPAGLKEATLCRISYQRPVEGCPTYTEYLKPDDKVPGGLCTIHRGTHQAAGPTRDRGLVLGRREANPRHFPVGTAGRMTRPILAFFALTYAATWTCWAAAAAVSRGSTPGDAVRPSIAGALFLLGTIAPSLVALAVTERAGGRAATRALLGRVFLWNVAVRWYVFAVGYMLAIKLSAALVYRVVTGGWPRFGDEAWYLMAIAIVFSTWVQAGEEIGWRGYVLPRLAARVGLAPASVILGVLWAGWHLPLFFVPAADTMGQSFPLYVLQVTALSVAAAWLYWRTGGSLLLVMLLHAAVNNTKDIVPSAVPGATNPFALSTSLVAWITATLLWIAAAHFLWRMRRGVIYQ